MEKIDGTHSRERENYASTTNQEVNVKSIITDLSAILTFIIKDYRNPCMHKCI